MSYSESDISLGSVVNEHLLPSSGRRGKVESRRVSNLVKFVSKTPWTHGQKDALLHVRLPWV